MAPTFGEALRIFFVVALTGPMWGSFFLEYYSVLLTPVSGIITILLALMAVVIISRRRAPKNISQDKQDFER